jgi:glycerophosphoryl diester phosphodiesterase
MTDDKLPTLDRRTIFKHAAAACMVTIYPSLEARATRRRDVPIIIGHRGASADRPEHTLAAYAEAIAQGADYIEPDLVRTKDGIFVARHENEISSTTDVGTNPAFVARQTTKIIDGQSFTGWFVEDFTLAELKTLRARERLPDVRAHNIQYDGQFDVPTLAEIIDLAVAQSLATGRRIGIYPETKHPSYHASVGLPMAAALVAELSNTPYAQVRDPIFIQSFEVGNLKELRRLTTIRLIQLMEDGGGPADADINPATPATYAQMLTADGLRQIKTYADGIGVAKSLMLPRDADNRLLPPTRLIDSAHAVGLKVHGWTFRPENYFLPADFVSSASSAARGDGVAEIQAFLAAGIDGLFADHPADAFAARAQSLPDINQVRRP